MKHSLNSLGFGLIAITFASFSQAESLVESDFSSPESVLYHDDKLFVSNVGKKLDPTAQDGDGYISLMSKNGDVVSHKYFDVTLNAPKGMAVYNNTLYVTDINRIVGLDLTSRQQVSELSLSQLDINFLNDLVATEDGILYVSATDTGDIYQINTHLIGQSRAASRLPITQLPGPNGLAYDKKTNALWVASFGAGEQQKGEFGKVDLRTYQYESIANTHGMLDGVALVSESKAILSDWVAFDNTGKIFEIDLNTGKKKTLFEKLGGPADFTYLVASKELVIPRMIESKVTIKSLP